MSKFKQCGRHCGSALDRAKTLVTLIPNLKTRRGLTVRTTSQRMPSVSPTLTKPEGHSLRREGTRGTG